MLKQTTKKILLGFVIFLLFNISDPFSVQAKKENEEEDNYTFLLKSPTQLDRFLKELEVDEHHFKVTVIEEIGLVYIEDVRGKNPQTQLSLSSGDLNKYISEEGELPELEPSLNDTNTIPVNRVTKKQTVEQKLEEVDKVQYPELGSSYFQPFNWYLEDVTNNFQTHSINKGNHTSIALVDSGVDENHPLLSKNIDLNAGKNYTSDELSVEDELGHGTSVAGILTSIAPDTTIVPYKVIGAEDGNSLWVLEAIVDAANDGNDIINLSLGTYKKKDNKDDRLLIKAYDLAVKYATKKGSLVVASAGNRGENLDDLKRNGEFHLPGSIKHAITVTSNSKDQTLSSYSNFGGHVDFSAPGGDLDENFDITGLVITTFPTNRPNNFIDQLIGLPEGYTLSYGTSLSAPQVSATAALIISEHKELKGKVPNVNKVINYLKHGSIDLGKPGYDRYYGHGKINAYQSLTSVKNK